MIPAVTSWPRCAGRQCRKIAPGAACEHICSFTWKGAKMRARSAASASCACPDVGIDGVHVLHSGNRIVGERNAAARGLRHLLRLRGYFRVGLKPFRRDDAYAASRAGSRQHQRMSNVVAVADVGHRDLLQVSEIFLQREVIGQRLARMLVVAQGVDDRDRRVFRHARHRLVRKGAQNDSIHPAFQVVSHIAQRLARAETRRRLVRKERCPAQRGDARLKGETRAQRWLLKEQHHLLALQRSAKIFRTRLDQRSQIE